MYGTQLHLMNVLMKDGLGNNTISGEFFQDVFLFVGKETTATLINRNKKLCVDLVMSDYNEFFNIIETKIVGEQKSYTYIH